MYNYQDILNTCYAIISTAQDSNTYPESVFRVFINKAQNDICFWTVANLSTGQRLEKTSMNWLEANTIIDVRPSAYLSQDTSVGATTLYCGNTLATSGTVWINGNIITYTGRTDTTLTGCSGVSYAWTGGTKVYPIYALPTDFGQLTRIFGTVSNWLTRVMMKSIDSRDLANPIPWTFAYSYFSTNWDIYGQEWYYSIIRWQYIFPMIMWVNPSVPLSLEYQIKPVQLVNPYDLVTIPDEYSLSTIPYMATAEMMANRWEMDEAMKLNNFGYNNIQSMYQFYGTQRQELMYNQRVGTGYDGYYNI